MNRWSGVHNPDYPFSETHVTADNDGAVVYVTKEGERLLDEAGNRLLVHKPEIRVCDNRLMDFLDAEKAKDKFVRQPNRRDRRKAKRRSK